MYDKNIGLAADTGEIGAGSQAESFGEIELVDQAVDRTLAMVDLDLGQDQANRVAVVTAAELQLRSNEFSCSVQGHRSRLVGMAKKGA